MLLLPCQIEMIRAGQGIEMSWLNTMVQLCRFAIRREEVVPAPGDMKAGGQPQNAVPDGVAIVMVVKKPRVNLAFAKGRLNLLQAHGHKSIVTREAGLRSL